MKAYNLYGIKDLRYEDVTMPNCPKGWAIVQVKAAGICSSDIARVFKKGTYHFPTIPGHEFSGVVSYVADKDNENLIGKKVGVFPLIPCKQCNQCKEKHYEMCEHYDYIGSRRDGGFAEYVAVPIWNLIVLPDNVHFIEAAMLEPLSVALHAVKIGNVKKGDNMAIVGTGMIGIAAGQWGYEQGANSISVFGRNESKRKLIENCNLNYFANITEDEFNKYDVVLEAVGTPSSITAAIQLAKPGGTIILMGNPASDIGLKQDVYWKILRKQLVVKGTWNSFFDEKNRSDWTEAVCALSKNMIDVKSLVTHTFVQEDLLKGLNLMYEHCEPYCKVMTIWNDK